MLPLMALGTALPPLLRPDLGLQPLRPYALRLQLALFPLRLCMVTWLFLSACLCLQMSLFSWDPSPRISPPTHTHSMTSSSKTQLPTRPLFTCTSGQNCDIFLGSAIRATMAPERVFRLSVPAVSTARLLEAGPRSILEDRRRMSAARLKPEAEVSVTVHLGLPDQRGTPPSVCTVAPSGADVLRAVASTRHVT